MSKNILIPVILVVLIIAVVITIIATSGGPSATPATNVQVSNTPPAVNGQQFNADGSPAGSVSPAQQAAPAPTNPTVPPPTNQGFTISANDMGASQTTLTVPKGSHVSITFMVDANNTYHGGLDFRSSVVNSGTIAPGASKTVTFTASKSFTFTPYWPSSNIAKPYTISVIVQ